MTLHIIYIYIKLLNQYTNYTLNNILIRYNVACAEEIAKCKQNTGLIYNLIWVVAFDRYPDTTEH